MVPDFSIRRVAPDRCFTRTEEKFEDGAFLIAQAACFAGFLVYRQRVDGLNV